MAVRLPSDPDAAARRKLPSRDAASPATVPQVIRKAPPMPARPARESRARNTIPEPLAEMTRDLIRAQGFAEPRFVADFQEAKGLKIDGVIGPKTMMAAVESNDGKSPPFTELHAYDPSWRDRIASTLIQWGVPEDTVEGLIGSRGLGPIEKNMGVGLVDLTPAGIPFAVDEAKRAWEAGNVADAALNMSGALPIPGAKILKPAKEAVEEGARFVRESIPIHPFPDKPQRPFEADYPVGAAADAAGRLTFTMDGYPLTADPRRIAGLRTVGGPDEAILRTEFDPMTQEATGIPAVHTPRSFLKGDAGRTGYDPVTGKPSTIYLADDLSSYDRLLAHGHEFGHVVDQLAGKIEAPDELLDQLHRVYSAGRTGVYRESDLVTPGSVGYPEEEATRELWAEAVRAYMESPNFLKSVAPGAAEAIRRVWNSDPNRSKIIQFNSTTPFLFGGAAAAASVLPQDAKATER